ncbi:hypothetical protein KS4_00780 [Poriferisphaera corsica]|uniref:Uncharacterized protein n=1 Tax=Poriferisphaera corsica TaxID=2528020 RepID=A0A517YP99_9BACT|nr:hypothetical protein [Poriferisphaera corsica]QDU32050.1 hypothetical protein KS4_00780 [Poriferisphaera corsica]
MKLLKFQKCAQNRSTRPRAKLFLGGAAVFATITGGALASESHAADGAHLKANNAVQQTIIHRHTKYHTRFEIAHFND